MKLKDSSVFETLLEAKHRGFDKDRILAAVWEVLESFHQDRLAGKEEEGAAKRFQDRLEARLFPWSNPDPGSPVYGYN